MKKILFIDDDEIECQKILRSLKELDNQLEVLIKDNAIDALDLLDEVGTEIDLVVLDLNMPLMNGFDFLKKLRKDEKLKRLPVVILTTSSNEKDFNTARESCVSGYFVKPLKYEAYKQMILVIVTYWLFNNF